MGTPSHLSAQDASFLYLETRDVRMTVAALVLLDPATRPGGPFRAKDLLELFEGRIHLVPRLRQKVVDVPLDAGRPVWVDDASFDLHAHIRRVVLPHPGTRWQLAHAVQEIERVRLERSRPLWDAYLIEGLEDARLAVLLRWHHALLDGMSGMEFTSVLFDPTPEAPAGSPQDWSPPPEPTPEDLLADAVADEGVRRFETALAWEQRALDPDRSLEHDTRFLGGLADFLRMGPSPGSPFNVPVGPDRLFSTADIPAAEAQRVRTALGGTVRDVVLTVAAGGLHRFLARRGLGGEGATLRAGLPVARAVRSRRTILGNHSSLLLLDLPVGPMEEVERLHLVTRAMEELTASQQATAFSTLMGLADLSPPSVNAAVARLVAKQDFVNVVISYMRGPRRPIYLAGARHVVTYPLLPLAERLALFIGAVDIAGAIGIGLTGDARAVGDLELLRQDMLDARDALWSAALGAGAARDRATPAAR